MTSKKSPIEDLILDPRLQARDALDHAAVEDYAAAYAAKREMPPIEVYDVGGALYVVDGWHRIAGARIAGVTFLRAATVGAGTIDDAIWRALASNRAHGVRRSNADKRRAVGLALESAIGAEQSSRVLAEHLGLSPDFVSRVRSDWEATRAPQLSSDDSCPPTRVGKDGKRRLASAPRRAPQSHVPDDDVPPLPHEPESSHPEGMPSYGPVLDRAADIVRRARLDLRALELETTYAQRAEAGLVSVESALRYAIPEACPRCHGARCMHCRDRGWVQRQEAEGLRTAG